MPYAAKTGTMNLPPRKRGWRHYNDRTGVINGFETCKGFSRNLLTESLLTRLSAPHPGPLPQGEREKRKSEWVIALPLPVRRRRFRLLRGGILLRLRSA